MPLEIFSEPKWRTAIVKNHSRYNRFGPVVGAMTFLNTHYLFCLDRSDRRSFDVDLDPRRIEKEWDDWGKLIVWFPPHKPPIKEPMFWVQQCELVEIIGSQRPISVHNLFLNKLGV